MRFELSIRNCLLQALHLAACVFMSRLNKIAMTVLFILELVLQYAQHCRSYILELKSRTVTKHVGRATL